MVDVVGVGEGAEAGVRFLAGRWGVWKGRGEGDVCGVGVSVGCQGGGWGGGWGGGRVWGVLGEGGLGFSLSLLSLPCHRLLALPSEPGLGDAYILTIVLSSQHARAYLIHSEPVGTPLLGRDKMGCNCFSSGEAQHTEDIMPSAYRYMLAFFKLVDDVPGYEELDLKVESDPAGEGDRVVRWVEGDVERSGPGVTFSMGVEGARGEGTL